MDIVKQLLGKAFGDLFSVEKACCTRVMGNQMFECRVRKPDPRYCEHSLSMGKGFICQHPDRWEFAQK
ncbi:MAG TPA: hypothetical protein VI389_04070 [Geobacteraceae bacterium]